MFKIKKSIIIVFFCLIVLQSGSFLYAAKKEKVNIPDWINTPSSVYPNSEYITYVGSGTDRKAAELEALKGIASVFGQSIKTETNASSRMVQAKLNGLIANSEISTIDQSVKKVVDVDMLIGVEIANFWFDEISTWYAIAVLDKKKASILYQDMVMKNIKAFNSLVKKIDKNDYSFDTYALYDFAEDISKENEKLLQRLIVIDSDSASNLKKQTIASKEVHVKKMNLAKELPIYIVIENDVDGRFEEAFYQAINSVGFRATLDGSVRYVLYAKFDFSRSDTSDKKTIRCKYNGETFIVDTMTGHQIIPYSLSGRESQVDFNEAKDKAVKKIIQKITSEYPDAMEAFLKEFIVE